MTTVPATVFFRNNFNQPIVGVVWPSSLQLLLSFGNGFNQPATGIVSPASLRQPSFGRWFNQPIACVAGLAWAVSLQQLSFGNGFSRGSVATFPFAAIVRVEP